MERKLGIDDLVVKNAAMLFKWWLRYTCEEGALWKEIVSSIHKEDLSLLPSKTRAAVPGPWRDIKKMAAEDSPVQNAFVRNLSIQVEDGMKTKFWQHPWLQNTILKRDSLCSTTSHLKSEHLWQTWVGSKAHNGDGHYLGVGS